MARSAVSDKKSCLERKVLAYHILHLLHISLRLLVHIVCTTTTWASARHYYYATTLLLCCGCCTARASALLFLLLESRRCVCVTQRVYHVALSRVVIYTVHSRMHVHVVRRKALILDALVLVHTCALSCSCTGTGAGARRTRIARAPLSRCGGMKNKIRYIKIRRRRRESLSKK